MLQLLYPWWMLALPICGLPWIWPVLRTPQGKFLPFSTLFLFPKEKLSRHFQWSSKEWLLKLLRSLLLLVLILLLAKPYFGSSEVMREITILDDTPSSNLHLSSASGKLLDWENSLRISQLLPEDSLQPLFSEEKFEGFHPGSPSLSTLASAALKRFPNESRLKLRLVSDFQYSQYWFYPAAVQPVNWVFERPGGIQPIPNLAMRNPRIKTSGLFEQMLSLKVYGNLESPGEVRITVFQQEQKVGETLVQWEGVPVSLSLPLSDFFQKQKPVSIRLETELEQADFDDLLHFQESTLNDLWVGIMTSEGPEGMFRHGLHALKSALNASGTYSYLVHDAAQMKELSPDVLILLGDHPLRWDSLNDHPPALFIPTRLDDWKQNARKTVQTEETLDRDNTSFWPEDQWLVDWSKASFADKWQVVRNESGNYESQTKGMVLLETGLSDAWGSLYRQDDFAGHVQSWLRQLENRMPFRSLGTFHSGSRELQSVVGSSRLPSGHYQMRKEPASDSESSLNPNSTRTFSVNLPPFESEMRLMSDDELMRMQSHFESRQPLLRQSELGSVEQIRQWLLWIALLFALSEIFLILVRRNSTPTA